MKAKMRVILTRAIEEGIAYGYSRAHKHTDEPNEEVMTSAIEDGIWNAIDEVIEFEEVYYL